MQLYMCVCCVLQRMLIEPFLGCYLHAVCFTHRMKQDLYGAMSAKQSALQLLQEREQQLSAVSSTANTCKQQLEHLQRSAP